ncbi:MAG TPA: ASKHA domain-containing protein [Methanofastidiosum sp.]|nr:ASKHA domain-containing protein [Methanofastidiosum sp.]
MKPHSYLEVYKIKIIVNGIEKEQLIENNSNLLDILNNLGIRIEAICGGKGKCGKCKVLLENPESASLITSEEKRLLSQDEISIGMRLGCLIEPKDGMSIVIPDSSLQKDQRILSEGLSTEFNFDPAIKSIRIKLPKPKLGGDESFLDYIKKELKREINIDYLSLKRITDELNYETLEANLVVFNNEIIGFKKNEEKIYGIAVDIGTTTVVTYLIDIETGALVDIESILNPQIKYGEDVISRITYSLNKGVSIPHNSIVDGINTMIKKLCDRNRINSSSIYEMTAVGNTAMHHIFLNINPRSLSVSPFTPVVSKNLDIKARDIGIEINPSGNIHVLPVISGFVGADTVGVLLATGLYRNDEISLAIDIGTNGELVLGNKEKMVSCSCAAGPALEGGHLGFGMRASTGAIESVFIDKDSFDTFYKTINKSKPRGFCGSGIIDIVAEMLKVGIIDSSGKIIENGNDRIRKNKTNNHKEFVVEWKEKTDIDTDIVITASDIREIQLAKGAIMTGINILLEKMKISADKIENLYLAGAFGNYIDIKNAIRIGLIPNIPLERIKPVGNAAGEGAKISLMSNEKRIEENILIKKIDYIELASENNFNEEFVKSLRFP